MVYIFVILFADYRRCNKDNSACQTTFQLKLQMMVGQKYDGPVHYHVNYYVLNNRLFRNSRGLTFYEPSPVEELELQLRRTLHLYHLFIFTIQNAWVKGKPNEIVFSLDVTQ